ncbi:MAG: hypothetical protein QOG80_1126 [Pseudonocardiales bacterium]|jgi:hypothetical protein|nr:hypothetical protein [Pseudonocardiales bacterium]
MPATRFAVRFSAASILAVEIAIHVALAPAHLREVPYIGAGFVLASVLLAVALIGVVVAPSNPTGWLLGAALSVGMAVLFLVSRLFGLPDYHEAWSSDNGLGLISLPLEIGFLVCAVATLSAHSQPYRPSARPAGVLDG